MIYTCTLNPSIDYLIELEQLHIGSLNRAEHSSFYPGGKGINVSRVLKNLGVTSTALGYVGGFTGDFIKEYLTKEEIKHQFIELEEPTRINIKLKHGQETELNGQGSHISTKKQEELLQFLFSLSRQDLLVLAGSLPPTVPKEFYSRIAEQCHERQIPFIVDTSGPALEDVLSYQPFLIKPNQHELSELLQVDIQSMDDALKYGRELLYRGAQNIIVSMGGQGAVLINKEICAYAQVPRGEVRNSVGAGDSTVAGFLASYLENQNLVEAFQSGVAAGTATAFSEDLCTKERVVELQSQIKVQKI